LIDKKLNSVICNHNYHSKPDDTLSLAKIFKVAHNPVIPAWKIDPSMDVKRVTVEDVQLVFGQAEKRLDDTVIDG
jgi:hypothetical protein